MRDICEQCDRFVGGGHFRAAEIAQKQAAISARYDDLCAQAEAWGQALADSLRLQQFVHDMDHEESWLRDKASVADSTDAGCEISGTQALLRLLNILQSEVVGHADIRRQVQDAGEALLAKGHQAAAEVFAGTICLHMASNVCLATQIARNAHGHRHTSGRLGQAERKLVCNGARLCLHPGGGFGHVHVRACLRE